jgi:hypothetical protein
MRDEASSMRDEASSTTHDETLAAHDDALLMRCRCVPKTLWEGKIPSKRFFLVAQFRIFDHGEGRFFDRFCGGLVW